MKGNSLIFFKLFYSKKKCLIVLFLNLSERSTFSEAIINLTLDDRVWQLNLLLKKETRVEKESWRTVIVQDVVIARLARKLLFRDHETHNGNFAGTVRTSKLFKFKLSKFLSRHRN